VRVRDDQGQALVIALAFLVFFGLVVSALLSFANTSVLSTEGLRVQRLTAYAADGATDAAIRLGQWDNTVGGYGDGRCQDPGAPLAATPTLLTTPAVTINATTTIPAATVRCTWSSDPFQADRTVTFIATTSVSSALLVRATVIYHDGSAPAGSQPPQVVVLSWVYCGHGASC